MGQKCMRVMRHDSLEDLELPLRHPPGEHTWFPMAEGRISRSVSVDSRLTYRR